MFMRMIFLEGKYFRKIESARDEDAVNIIDWTHDVAQCPPGTLRTF